MTLDEKDYPKHLCEAYYIKNGKKLNLHNPKLLSEKIQWLKIYDNKPIKTQLTDKVLVRDWIKNKIGEEYLKPALQVCSDFDEIDFENMPDCIVVKCNHGCKWNFTVKNKTSFLENKKLFNVVKKQTNDWLSRNFFGWSDFETQYKDIKPQLIVEPYFSKDIKNFQIWCFNGSPKIIQQIWNENNDGYAIACVTTFDENYNFLDLNFTEANLIETKIDENVQRAVELSKTLCSEFKFVRVDWMISENRLYFEEMTFTPFSGFIFNASFSSL